MSCSDVYFNISGNGQLKVVDIKIDNGDLYHYFNGDMSKVLQGFNLVFEPTLVFDKYGKGYSCKSDFVRQIVLCDAFKESNWVALSTYAIVGYHHSGDPTDLEVVYEVGRILQELGYNLNNF